MMKVRTMIAAAGVALGALAGVAATAQAAPASGSRGSAFNCQKWAKTHTFVHIVKAKGNPRTGLTVTGDLVKVQCGVADDHAFLDTNKRFTGHLLPSAKITVLSSLNPTFSRLPQSKFAHWVATGGTEDGNIYIVYGPFKAIREVDQQFHP